MNDPIREWAHKYSDEIGDVPKSLRPAAQRARILFGYRGAQKRGLFERAPFSLAQLAAASGALILTGLLLWHATPGVSAPNASENSLPALEQTTVGKQITTAEAPMSVSFPGGTRAVWNPKSSGSVSKVSSDAVELTLNEGSLALDVQRQEGRTWVVRSGKFRVYVIGTAFTVSRVADSEEFQVKVQRGRVRIEGPDIEGGKLLLGAREEFAWRPHGAAPSATQLTLPSSNPSSKAPTHSAPPPKGPQIPSQELPDPKVSESWQTFARAGKYELAIEEVEKMGATSVLAGSNADDRLLLGNAARYSGRIELGSRAYLAARESGGAAASLAAYYLAKIAIDTNGDKSGAIRWLKTYLREAPSGDLAPSARARLMNLLQSAGNQAEAEKVAREYLTLHPAGPNAQTARKLLEHP